MLTLVGITVGLAVGLGVGVRLGWAVALGVSKSFAPPLLSVDTSGTAVGGSGSIVAGAARGAFSVKTATAVAPVAVVAVVVATMEVAASVLTPSGPPTEHPTPHPIVHNNPSAFHNDDCRIK